MDTFWSPEDLSSRYCVFFLPFFLRDREEEEKEKEEKEKKEKEKEEKE